MLIESRGSLCARALVDSIQRVAVAFVRFLRVSPRESLQADSWVLKLKLLESDANGCNLPLPRRSSSAGRATVS